MGSHSSSSSVVQNNTTVIINMINASAASGAPGISKIPAGSDAAAVEGALSNALMKTLAAEWTKGFPGESMPGDTDMGFLIAPAILSMDMKVPCAVQQMSQDLESWQITAPAGTSENIVHTILMNLIMKSGIIGASHGHKTIGPAQNLKWACAALYGQAGAESHNEHLIGYMFAASN
jgi:hypothetical protein